MFVQFCGLLAVLFGFAVAIVATLFVTCLCFAFCIVRDANAFALWRGRVVRAGFALSHRIVCLSKAGARAGHPHKMISCSVQIFDFI